MRAHEVPTHVQAEDRVLLWLTFPQIVAMTAVCALAYGIYHYAPVGPAGVRIAAAVLFGLCGFAVVAGRVNGRRLPLVAADLLRYALGARRYAGPPSEFVREEPPAPVQPPGGREGDPLRLLAKRMLRRTRRTAQKRKEGERRTGRLPFRPHRLFGKRRRRGGEQPDAPPPAREDREQRLGDRRRGKRGFWKSFFAASALALVALTALPLGAAFADSPADEGWSSEEIEFQPPPEVPGRRLFVEELTVAGDRAAVRLRAATDLDLRVRAYGGSDGRSSRYYAVTSLDEGERATYDLPLDGPSPSLVFSWEDEMGQAGAVSLDGERLPWPLPAAAGELCSLRVTSLGWTPNAISGAVASECASTIEERVDLPVSTGHHSQSVTALLDAEVTAVTGTLTVSSGARETAVAFVAGETRFRLPVAAGEGVHALAIEASLEASLRIALPPLVQLTHHPERTERLTETATVDIPSYGDTVTETVSVPGEDGSFTDHTVTASCYAPASTVSQDVVFSVVHKERVEATVTDRAPLTLTRTETLAPASSIRADDAYRALTVPDAEPEPESPTQTPATGDDLREWFDGLGWEWPW